MPLTDQQLQSLLVAEVGDTENGALTTQVAAIWSYWTDSAGLTGLLRDLYVKRSLCDVALGAGGERLQVDVTTPNLGARQSQRATALRAMRDATQAEIIRVEAITKASGVPVAGQLAAVAPRTVDDALAENVFGFPDANAPQWRGDVYRRTFPL